MSSNTVNNDEDHKGMDLEEADGNDDLDSGANSDRVLLDGIL